MPETKLALPCNCVGTCGVALVSVLEPWGDDPMEAFVSFHDHAGYETLRGRLRGAWRVLRGRDPWLHDVSLSVEQMQELADFVSTCVAPAPRKQADER